MKLITTTTRFDAYFIRHLHITQPLLTMLTVLLFPKHLLKRRTKKSEFRTYLDKIAEALQQKSSVSANDAIKPVDAKWIV